MTACVFGGPTLYGRETYGLAVYPPARLGSAYWAWQQGYHRVAIIDGYFGSVPSIWHKELLYIISMGVEVWGAGSMGALRAAELWPYGMGGAGFIWRLYRRGVLTDDDEVCVTHAPPYLDYRPLTEALVNVRFSARAMRRLGLLTADQERLLVVRFKSLHFSQRTTERLRECLPPAGGDAAHEKLWAAYLRIRRDQKAIDTDLLLSRLAAESTEAPRVPAYDFPATLHWRRQFVERLHELPPGDRDPFE